ncbi:hypothetical protein N0V93_000209 [Gnomoniopsis smithogilvyi]|uniref:Cytochrome P450 n=1 Tax=Gnomoniopsis smithogilvyi TaxID=1191159 RepID=A0A9W8Z1H2_9PEZI|nr:hypothetical protein N0V93_000209 [Gnomoniopsis smithogilvyi]
MAVLQDAVAAWPLFSSKGLVVNVVLILMLVQVIWFLYSGIRIRLRFRKLQAQGIDIAAPYSFFLGHLPLIRKLSSKLPHDANNVYSTRDFATNWQKYFPNAAAAPAVVYLDLWPVASSPIAVLTDPGLSQQLVSGRFPPRHDQLKRLARAIAGKRNLFEWDGAEHRLWRTRLNPGFSIRSLQSHIAKGRIVDEVQLFAKRMKESAGPDGAWGTPFQMFPKAVDLTFDIICGVMLGFSPGEQENGPTEFQIALRTLATEYMAFSSLLILHKKLNPFWHLRYYQYHETLRQALLPHIHRNLNAQKPQSKDSSFPTTIVDLTLAEIQRETESPKSKNDFIEDVIGLTKQFIFAGHDTTAIALTYTLHFMSRNPDTLQKMREEHDQVFGKDPSQAPELLRASPHLLGSLPYTTAAIKETLRLTSIAASIREAVPGFTLRDEKTGKVYPTDGFILTSGVRNLHHSSDVWPRVTEYLPERFLAAEGDPLCARRGHAWRPFEIGPMSCIGQELAMMELKMALVFTAREVEFEAALEEWDKLQGKGGSPRPIIDGDTVYQSSVSPLGPPVEGLPMRVRLLSRR